MNCCTKYKRNISRLVVVGNGFDLEHGLETKYSDFRSYVCTYAPEFYKKIGGYIPEEVLWSEFESALAELDYEELQEENSCYLLGYGEEEWRDSAHYDFQYEIDKALSFAKDISEQLKKWILTVDIECEAILSSQIINNDSTFISFNYTNTLEHAYNIFPENILYIHGKALEKNRLDVGHHNTKVLDSHVNMINEAEIHSVYMSNNDDVRVNQARDTIKDYFKQTYKDTSLIIDGNKDFFDTLAGIEEIYVIGHSLSTTDRDYFLEIKKHVPDKSKWIFTYYTDQDIKNINDTIIELGINNCEKNFIENLEKH